MLMRMSH